MRRKSGFALLVVLCSIVFLALMPERTIPVFAHRTVMWANQDWSRHTSNRNILSLYRIEQRTGVESDRSIVRDAVDEALTILEEELDYEVQRPFRVVLDQLPDGTLGYYRVGVVGLLPPSYWLSTVAEESRGEIYSARGPVLHELTHYVVDLMAQGNYPGWLTEGLALFMELKHQNTRWRYDRQYGRPMTYGNIDRYLSHPVYYVDAYAQSLSMVEYLYQLQGSEGMQQLLRTLGQGHSLERALQEAYGLGAEELMLRWLALEEAG